MTLYLVEVMQFEKAIIPSALRLNGIFPSLYIKIERIDDKADNYRPSSAGESYWT